MSIVYMTHHQPTATNPVGRAKRLRPDQLARLALAHSKYDAAEAMAMQHRMKREPVDLGRGFHTVPMTPRQEPDPC